MAQKVVASVIKAKPLTHALEASLKKQGMHKSHAKRLASRTMAVVRKSLTKQQKKLASKLLASSLKRK